MASVKCLKCGHASFRYTRRDRQSYCLTCGTTVSPDVFKRSIGRLEEGFEGGFDGGKTS